MQPCVVQLFHLRFGGRWDFVGLQRPRGWLVIFFTLFCFFRFHEGSLRLSTRSCEFGGLRCCSALYQFSS